MAAKKRTRKVTIPENHDVAHHELLTCVVCKREFWGDCGFRDHGPCINEEFTRVAHEQYLVPSTGNVLVHQPGKPFIRVSCFDRYTTMMARVENARENRGHDN